MSNAERQARWRARQAQKRDGEIEAEIARRINAGLTSAPCVACAEKDREIARLRAAKPRPPATPRERPNPSEVEARLRAENRLLRRRLRDTADKLNLTVDQATRTLYMLPGDRRTLLRALHPDLEQDPARKRLLTRAAQIFNQLKIETIDLD
jgi:hypothetical protein